MWKAIKGHHVWLPIERAVRQIAAGSLFSHGFCTTCQGKAMQRNFATSVDSVNTPRPAASGRA